MNYVNRLIKSNDFCMLELEFFAFDSNRDNQNSILFERRRDQHIAFEDIQSKTDSNWRQWRCRCAWLVISSDWNAFILILQRISSYRHEICRMLCSRNYYHKNEIMHVSQAWKILLLCTHVMIIRNVCIYWKRFSIWSQNYRLYSWIFHRSYKFCSIATISWKSSLWFETWSMSRRMMHTMSDLEMSMQNRTSQMTMMSVHVDSR
jgi:hypothetical protein